MADYTECSTNKQFRLQKIITSKDSLPQIRKEMFLTMMQRIIQENVDEFTVKCSFVKIENLYLIKEHGILDSQIILILYATLV